MKLQLAQVPPVGHVKAVLDAQLPQYRSSIRLGRMVDCQKGFFTGATIIPKRDGLVINGSFPSAGANMIFVLIMFASGILIGLLLWLIIWRSGQNRVRDEVARVLAPVYGAQLPPGVQPALPMAQAAYPQQPPQQHQAPYPHQQPQQPQQQQQYPQAQGFPVGARVLVVAGDGNRYPATIAQAAQGQYLCTMPDGNAYWFPQQSVGPAQ